MKESYHELIARAIKEHLRDPYAPVTLPFAIRPEDLERLRQARAEGIRRLRRREEGA